MTDATVRQRVFWCCVRTPVKNRLKYTRARPSLKKCWLCWIIHSLQLNIPITRHTWQSRWTDDGFDLGLSLAKMERQILSNFWCWNVFIWCVYSLQGIDMVH